MKIDIQCIMVCFITGIDLVTVHVLTSAKFLWRKMVSYL